jgi:hypothetical protein
VPDIDLAIKSDWELKRDVKMERNSGTGRYLKIEKYQVHGTGRDSEILGG